MVRTCTVPLRMHTRAKEFKRNLNPYSDLLKNFDVCPTHHPQQHSSNTSIFWNTPQQLKDCEANSQTVPQTPGLCCRPLHSGLSPLFLTEFIKSLLRALFLSPFAHYQNLAHKGDTTQKARLPAPLPSSSVLLAPSAFSYFHTTECPGTMRAD